MAFKWKPPPVALLSVSFFFSFLFVFFLVLLGFVLLTGELCDLIPHPTTLAQEITRWHDTTPCVSMLSLFLFMNVTEE